MSRVTPSTAFTVWRARPNNDPPAAGKWTLRSRIESNGLRSACIKLRLSTRRRSRLRNGRANDARASAARTVETQFGKCPGPARTAARTDTLVAGAPDPAALPESDRDFSARPKGRAPNARVRACTDCRVARKALRSALAQTLCRRT